MVVNFRIHADGHVSDAESIRQLGDEQRNKLSKDIFTMVQPHHKAGIMGFCPMSSYNSAQTRSRSFIVAAYSGERLAGFVHVDLRKQRGKSRCHSLPFFHVRQIARDGSFKNLGSHLMNIAIEYARGLDGNIRVWYTEVVEGNIPSLKMFEKFGMKSIGTENGIVAMETCIE